MNRAACLVNRLLETYTDDELEHLKASARDYALYHGLTPESCCLVIGRKDGSIVALTQKPGAVRWQVTPDFERDGGVFPSWQTAKVALARVRAVYGEVDTAVSDIEVLPIHGQSFAA